MKVTLNHKNNDCFICAYATCEGISWKIAKRRLRKYRKTKKKLGVMNDTLNIKGLVGYNSVPDGDYDSLNQAFNFKKGIIIISFGDKKGHALVWDGCKIRDNVSGSRFNNKNNFSEVSGQNFKLVGAWVKDECNTLHRVLSYIHHTYYKVLSKLKGE